MSTIKNALLLMIALTTFAHAKETKMEPQKQEIIKTIQIYVDGYLNAKKELVSKAFYHETKLYSVDENKIDKTEMNDWLKNFDERSTRGDIRTANLEIGFIDVTADTAVAKIFLYFEKYTFVDYLSLLNIDKNWIIVGKIYSMKEINMPNH
jgi:hypothetical protein